MTDLGQSTLWPDRPPRPEPLLNVIRRLAKAGRITYSAHVLSERCPERGFDIFDIRQALAHGSVSGRIRAGRGEDEWIVKLVDVPEGTSRKMGVVTVVVRERRLIIATVEWEDK